MNCKHCGKPIHYSKLVTTYIHDYWAKGKKGDCGNAEPKKVNP